MTNTMRITKPFMLVAAALLTLYLVAGPGFGAVVFVIAAALAVGMVAAIVEDNF